jgi:ferrous-iron efflux pump FieF
LFTSWKLLWEAVDGLMDRSDPRDDAAVRRVLDAAVAEGTIRAYHKVRHRHTGRFHWVDLHVQVDPGMTVKQAHDTVTAVEMRIEESLGREQTNATAHVEPYDPVAPNNTIPPV